MNLFQRVYIHLIFSSVYFLLCYYRLQRSILGAKIAVLAFQCRLFGLDEGKVLSKYRCTSVLVDEFFEVVKQSHVRPCGYKRPILGVSPHEYRFTAA